MSVIDIGSVWANGDQLTPAVMNAKWTGATFNASAVDASTTALSSGAIIVKSGGVTATQLGTDSVITVKIQDAAVTAAKLATTQDWTGYTITLPVDSVVTASITDANVTFAKLATAAVATQAQLEAETASTLVAADLFKYHPGAAKAYGLVDASTNTLLSNYNVTSATTVGTLTTIVLAAAMSDANYSVVTTNQTDTSDNNCVVNVTGKTTTGFVVESDVTTADFSFVVYGDLA